MLDEDEHDETDYDDGREAARVAVQPWCHRFQGRYERADRHGEHERAGNVDAGGVVAGTAGRVRTS